MEEPKDEYNSDSSGDENGYVQDVGNTFLLTIEAKKNIDMMCSDSEETDRYS